MTDAAATTPPEPDEAAPARRRTTLWAMVTAVAVGRAAVLLIVGLTDRGVSTSVSPLGGPAGRQVSVADLRGRRVVLDMRASWCEPGTDEAPIVRALSRDYARAGVVVLGVDVRDLLGSARGFAGRQDLAFPSVGDGEGDCMGRHGATAVPETFVIDREGRVALALRGPLVGTGAARNGSQFHEVLDEIVAERPAAEART